MKHFIITISFTISIGILSYGQSSIQKCDCPKNEFTETKADTTFQLANGKKISLCGYRIEDTKPVKFSEFVLAVCGQNKIIEFWGAVQTCFLKVKKDTLLVQDLVNLPTGLNRKYREDVWGTNKIYFKGETVIKVYSVNKGIPKYSKSDIIKTLKEFEISKGVLSDGKMELANRLFIATISGDTKARKYFREFRTKFGGLSGAYAEEYRDLKVMLSQWDKSNTNK